MGQCGLAPPSHASPEDGAPRGRSQVGCRMKVGAPSGQADTYLMTSQPGWDTQAAHRMQASKMDTETD
eukprot:4971287-Prymnesium_polylepis.1